jgi:AbiU2
MHDAQFERELEVFRTEAETGIQFFYAYLTVHAVAAKNEAVYRLLNKAPLFWNTSLGALQTAAFIALGRVFDQNSTHNLDRLLRIAQDNPQIFSKGALGRRKQGTNPDPPEWLDDYLSDMYEPTPQDFRRLRGHVRKWRKIYVSNYRDLRHKLFAHKEVSDRAEIDALFAKTNIRELQRMFAFLGSLHEALWHLFFNGRKPVLRPQRYSVKRIRDLPSPARRINAVQERIIHEAEQCLVALAGVTQ